MTQRFETRQWVPYPVELVFAFFANPVNLPLLMPPALQTRIDEMHLQPPPPQPLLDAPERPILKVAAGVGSEMLISFRPISWLPGRVRWLARITEFVWNSHFCDRQINGPFAYVHHRHGTRAEDRDGQPGTVVSDEIEYVLPFGIIGRLGDILIRRQMEHSFAQRQKRLPEMLAVADSESQRNLTRNLNA